MVFRIIAAQPRRIIWPFFSKKKSQYLQNIVFVKKFSRGYESDISELKVELRGNSPFDQVKDDLFVPYEYYKLRKLLNVIPVTIDGTQRKRRSLKKNIFKTNNWLKSCDLIPRMLNFS